MKKTFKKKKEFKIPQWKILKLLRIQEYNKNPKRCKHCGEPIQYEKNIQKNTFCSRSCSASFCNEGREISDKAKKNISKGIIKHYQELKYQRIKKECNGIEEKIQEVYDREIKGIKKCSSCNNDFKPHYEARYCDLCKPFTSNAKMFNKLGICDKNLQNANTKAIEILTREYFKEKRSLPEIRKKYGIMLNTVHFFLKKNGIDLRTRSESTKEIIRKGRYVLVANKKYKCGYHITWYGEKIFYRSSYEQRVLHILDELKEKYTYEKTMIPYHFNEKESFYFPDFVFKDRNLIIEAKGERFLELEPAQIRAKTQAAENLGYRVILMSDKEIREFEKHRSIEKLLAA